MVVLLDQERIATIGCRKQCSKDGMVVCKYDTAFTECSEIAELNVEEAVAFVERCMMYQETEERWHHFFGFIQARKNYRKRVAKV